MSTSALAARRASLADYLDLTKPRITFLVMLTAFVGYALASAGASSPGRLAAALCGTGLVAASASALNMVLERETDARMRRTERRPLPAGRLTPREATTWGVILGVPGELLLLGFCGPLPAAIALVTWTTYLFLYTPLKPRTSLATLVGAVPGALPPVIGWTAAHGQIDPGAYILFALLFLWQVPHFLAIASIYREDYARAGLPMLPVLDPVGALTGRQAVTHSLALLLVSLTPTAAGLTGVVYLIGACIVGIAFVSVAVWAGVRRTTAAARVLFVASIADLCLVCALLLIDRV